MTIVTPKIRSESPMSIEAYPASFKMCLRAETYGEPHWNRECRDMMGTTLLAIGGLMLGGLVLYLYIRAYLDKREIKRKRARQMLRQSLCY